MRYYAQFSQIQSHIEEELQDAAQPVGVAAGRTCLPLPKFKGDVT